MQIIVVACLFHAVVRCIDARHVRSNDVFAIVQMVHAFTAVAPAHALPVSRTYSTSIKNEDRNDSSSRHKAQTRTAGSWLPQLRSGAHARTVHGHLFDQGLSKSPKSHLPAHRGRSPSPLGRFATLAEACPRPSGQLRSRATASSIHAKHNATMVINNKSEAEARLCQRKCHNEDSMHEAGQGRLTVGTACLSVPRRTDTTHFVMEGVWPVILAAPA